MISLIQLEAYRFGWFSEIIICQISHMSISIRQSSKCIFSLSLLGSPTVRWVWGIQKALGQWERRNLNQKSSASLVSPFLLHPLLSPTCSLSNEWGSYILWSQCFSDSFTLLYVPYPFLSFEFAIFPACAIQRLPGVNHRCCETWTKYRLLIKFMLAWKYSANSYLLGRSTLTLSCSPMYSKSNGHISTTMGSQRPRTAHWITPNRSLHCLHTSLEYTSWDVELIFAWKIRELYMSIKSR